MRPERVITFNGFTGTVREWAKRIPLDLETLKSRLLRGWPLERALTLPRLQPRKAVRGRLICYQGEWASIPEWAKRTGLTEMCIYYRLARGRTVEEALTEPRFTMPRRLYQQVEVNTTRCFFCKRVIEAWKFVTEGALKGAPVCGAPDCVAAPERVHPWRLGQSRHLDQPYPLEDIQETAEAA